MSKSPTGRGVLSSLRVRRIIIDRFYHEYSSLPAITDDINLFLVDGADIAVGILSDIIGMLNRQDLDGASCFKPLDGLNDDYRNYILTVLERMPDILMGCQVREINLGIFPDRDNEALSLEFKVIPPRVLPSDEITEAVSRLVMVLVNNERK